jgi:uncharacterized protein (DUF885 family)
MLTRRAMLAGSAALSLVAATDSADADVQSALDAAAQTRDPAQALAVLAAFDPARLNGFRQLDLLTARAGLAVDRQLVDRGIDPHAKVAINGDEALYRLLLARKLGPVPPIATIDARLAAEQAKAIRVATHLFDQLRIQRSTPGARFAALWADPAQRYADSEAGRDRLVAEMNAGLPAMLALAEALIGPFPAYCRNVGVSRGTPADQAAGRVGVRTLPTAVSAGAYVIDLASIADRPRASLPSVLAHEVIPGHLIQLSIEIRVAPHPLRLAYAPAFAEGWGIHVERQVAVAGAWRTDPAAMLGYLHWRLFRLARARIDIGLHCHGWTLEAARARWIDWQGVPAYFAPFDSDLARIAGDPATRTAEMLAALAMEDGARGRSGPQLRAYHQALLIDGRMRSDQIAHRGRA